MLTVVAVWARPLRGDTVARITDQRGLLYLTAGIIVAIVILSYDRLRQSQRDERLAARTAELTTEAADARASAAELAALVRFSQTLGFCTDAETLRRTVLEELPRLKPIVNRAGGVLSGGEQQILAIARCLCGKPRLIMLDEPTEGIQPSIVEEIVEILKDLQARRGLTVIIVEQDLEFIAALSQRVYAIQRGRITSELSPQQLANPEVLKKFVGMGPR